MIKFFRKIRQQLLNEGKTSKYFKYALGEIILVVIGILIALQVNNWNTQRKSNIRKEAYINTLIIDLKKDSAQLSRQNLRMQNDLDKIISFSKRLSKTTATIDTVRQIYNYEFTGRFDISISLNKNTYDVIISTGEINLFNPEFKNNFLNFYGIQNSTVQVIYENNKLYMDRVRSFKLPPRELLGINNQGEFGIKGHLREQILDSYSDNDVLVEFENFMRSKAQMQENIIYMKVMLIEKTSDFLTYLYTLKND